jgi:cytochrome c-type biogenesis protein
MVEVNILVSALAGVGSFFSPCILPILPAFISYLSGTTINEVQSSETSNNFKGRTLTLRKSTRLNIFLNTVYFVLGFSLIFAVLGVILNSVLSTIGIGFQSTLQSIGGIVIVTFGAYLILSTKLRTLNFEKKMTKIPR